MVKSWLVAAIGSLFAVGSSTGAGLPHNDRPPVRERPATSSRERNERPASSTRQTKIVDIACVGAAVAARETALTSAASTETQAIAAAYTARASALSAAYQNTDPTQAKAAVKKAWSDFTSATKGAKQTWQRSRENSWKTYRDAAKQCKGAEDITDSSNMSADQ